MSRDSDWKELINGGYKHTSHGVLILREIDNLIKKVAEFTLGKGCARGSLEETGSNYIASMAKLEALQDVISIFEPDEEGIPEGETGDPNDESSW